MYGPDDGEDKFVSFLIQSMQNGVKELDLTDGIQIRDFIYVDDVVSAYVAILNCLEKLTGYCHFEVGTGVSHTVRELAEMICVELAAETKINFGGSEGIYPLRYGLLSRQAHKQMPAVHQ